MYSDLYIQNQKELRIPKVFIIAVVALLAVLSTQVFMWYRAVPTEASPIKLLQHEKANLSDSSVTLFYQTSEQAKTYVLYGANADKLTESAYETGDVPGSPKARAYHTVEIDNLEPFTTYYYKIITDNKQVLGEGDRSFTLQTTTNSMQELSARKPVYGKVVKPDGQGLDGAIVLVQYDLSGKSDILVVRTKNSGEWLTTLSPSIGSEDIIIAEIMHEDFKPSTIQMIFEKATPVPQSTVIGTDYNFTTKKGMVLPASTERSNEESYSISLLYPLKDSLIPNNKPLFRGFGIPGTPVSIKVNSRPPFEAKTTIDKLGSWSIEPSQAFAPGTYVVAVTVQDNLGALRVINRGFGIAKSGEQVLGESTNATPSATLAPKTTVTITQPPKVSPTTTPGVTIVTATPAFAVTSTITPAPPIPGGEFPLWFIVLGSLTIAFGTLLIRLNPINMRG